MTEISSLLNDAYGPRRLSVELTNICNLHCSYCLRDEDALYHSPANFLSADFLEKTIVQARDVMAITNVVFTGGEPTLHPQFERILEIVQSNGLRFSFVTNGWHFERVWPALLAHRDALASVGFSVDGATRESHDYWRGDGSFVRLVKAITRCYANDIPFSIKVVVRRDTLPQLEQIALFAGRLGATSLNFAHLLQTAEPGTSDSVLTLNERRQAEQEIASLARIFKMKVGLDVGYYNVDPAPPCSPLAGVSANVDYRGRLSLCCNLSGFRGAIGEGDVVSDLNVEDFSLAYARLSELATRQLDARKERLTLLAQQGLSPDLNTGSPCLFCLDSLIKLPWRQPELAETAHRALPVLT